MPVSVVPVDEGPNVNPASGPPGQVRFSPVTLLAFKGLFAHVSVALAPAAVAVPMNASGGCAVSTLATLPLLEATVVPPSVLAVTRNAYVDPLVSTGVVYVAAGTVAGATGRTGVAVGTTTFRLTPVAPELPIAVGLGGMTVNCVGLPIAVIRALPGKPPPDTEAPTARVPAGAAASVTTEPVGSIEAPVRGAFVS